MKLSLIGLSVALTISCAKDWNAALPEAPTVENPCGITGVACASGDKLTGMCCSEGFTCCDGNTCPKGQCEDINEGQGLEKRRPSPQWRAYPFN